MNCHIVPQVYLRSWRIPEYKNSIYLFDKSNFLRSGVQANIEKLKNTEFVAWDKYLLKTENNAYAYQLYPEFSQLFDTLKHYNISCKEKCITTVDEFINNYSKILTWEIQDGENIINQQQIKLLLENLWEENVEQLIEKYFDKNIENNWNEFLSYINNKLLLKRNWIVKAERKEYFLEFITIQLSRRFENLKKFGIDFVIDWFTNFIQEKVPEKNLSDILDIDTFKEDLCLIQLYKYVKYSCTSDATYENNSLTKVINLLNNQMQLCFFIAPPTIDFISSDNPCVHIPLGSKGLNYFSGIYLPINKRVCAFLCKNPTSSTLNKYLIINVCVENVKFINYLILVNSIKHVAYDKPSIANMINKSPNIKKWIEMFNEVELEHVEA